MATLFRIKLFLQYWRFQLLSSSIICDFYNETDAMIEIRIPHKVLIVVI